MPAALFSNNATTTLTADITSGATSFNVTSGAAFPAVSTGGDYFHCTLIDNSNNIEIVRVTNRATNIFTVLRAQEGTTARAFTASTCKVELRPTAAGLNSKFDKGGGTVTGATTFAANVTLQGATLTVPTSLTVAGGSVNYTGGLQLNGTSVVTASSAASFSNKTFETTAIGNNFTINGNTLSGPPSSNLYVLPTSAGTLATLSNTETFTNKTITALKAASTIVDTDTSGTPYAIGFKEIPPVTKTEAYRLVMSDSGKHINITTGGITIPGNSGGTAPVAFPIGTTVVFYNNSATSQTISIDTDVMRLAGTSSSGTRTLAPYGLATALKVFTNGWVISGAGLS